MKQDTKYKPHSLYLIAISLFLCFNFKITFASEWEKYNDSINSTHSGEIEVDEIKSPEPNVFDYSIRRGKNGSARNYRAMCNKYIIQSLFVASDGTIKIDWEVDATTGDLKDQLEFVCKRRPSSKTNEIKSSAQTYPTEKISSDLAYQSKNKPATNNFTSDFPGDDQSKCESELANRNIFSSILDKLPIAGVSSISFKMMASESRPTASEKKIISEIAELRRECARLHESDRRVKFSEEIVNELNRRNDKITSNYLDLYKGKLTYGAFSSRLENIDREYRPKIELLITRNNAKRAEQEQVNRAREAALRDAQLQQEQQLKNQRKQKELAEQTERDHVTAVRRQWEARCEFDRKNAYMQTESRERAKCDDLTSKARGTGSALYAFSCIVDIENKANSYAKAAYDACMSGAP